MTVPHLPRGLLLLVGALLLGGFATWLTAGWLERAAQAGVGNSEAAL